MVGVRCASFNAFGFRYQREILGLGFDIPLNERVWNELMTQAVTHAGYSLKGTKRGSNPVGEFLRARERACADLMDPDEIEVELQPFDGQPSIVVNFGPIDREFERLRVGRMLQSFDDQVTTTVKALLEFPEKRAYVQNYFSHILVDEFQDLNAAQLALVDIISRPWRNVFVVGDDDQLIYSWRYAKLTNILEFEQRMPAASTYVLSTNYRCSAAIVDASSRVIANNRGRVKKDIRARECAPVGLVRYFAASSYEERAQALVEFVKKRKEECGHWHKIAVLCRYKAQQPLVAIALDHAAIPRTPLLRYRLFSDRNMRLLRIYIGLVLDPPQVKGDELAQIINRPNRFASNELVAALKAAPSPWEALRSHLAEKDEEAAFRRRALSGFCARRRAPRAARLRRRS